MNELGNFEFMVSIVIWYEILYFINEVSKHLQRKDMLIDVAIQQVNALISTFDKYRENGFSKALDTTRQIANDMNIDPCFPKRREIRRKKQFDESSDDSSRISEEESFRINYFLYLIDQAISSLKKRFEQYKEYENIFGFMFSTDKLCSVDDSMLESCCINLENALRSKDESDVDGHSFYLDLQFFKEFIPKEKMGPLEIIKLMKKVGDCFLNAMTAYRILLTILVIVPSAERSFSKLKLLKSYLRSTMSRDRLNGLAMITIENNLLEKFNYEELIEDFASSSFASVATPLLLSGRTITIRALQNCLYYATDLIIAFKPLFMALLSVCVNIWGFTELVVIHLQPLEVVVALLARFTKGSRDIRMQRP
ncbi:uncharacterized protein LOC141634894 [Silene latifolia]|uniref:uncharacterized protein LOC141634894 n=1 Tax=Silene latifolia TaxID=37657 RepID=UPI003D76D2C6